MKKRIVVFLFICCFLFPSRVSALSVSARSACLMETTSGRVLYEKDKDNPRLIASITKIMTAILAIESNRLEEVVTVGEEVLTMYGSNIYLEVGEKMRLRDMVYGLMLRSGNDAALVIAVFLEGSEEKFVDAMNAKAQEIGMKNTVFYNAHGLDEVTENKSSAYDMALLSSYVSKNEEYMKIVGTKKYTVQTDKKSYLWHNRNKLLSLYDYAIGGKTGYTPRAGRTLVTNAQKDGLNLTAVTLNDGNEYDTHQALYDYAFENYKLYTILDKDKFRVDEGFYKDKAYIKQSFSYPLTEEEKDQIKVLVQLEGDASYQKDEAIGEVIVTLDGEEIYRDTVYGKQIQKRSFWDIIWSFFS